MLLSSILTKRRWEKYEYGGCIFMKLIARMEDKNCGAASRELIVIHNSVEKNEVSSCYLELDKNSWKFL